MSFDENDPDWFNEFGEPEDDDEMYEDFDQHNDRVDKLPVMIKAKELFDIVSSLVDTIPEDNDLYFLREQMLTDAAIIPAKVAGAEGGDMYTLRMENAVLIKLAARALVTHTYTCKMFNISDERYLNLLRTSVDEFRVLFVEWVNTFDKSNDISDDWGELFR
jgi:hypothetical protein